MLSPPLSPYPQFAKTTYSSVQQTPSDVRIPRVTLPVIDQQLPRPGPPLTNANPAPFTSGSAVRSQDDRSAAGNIAAGPAAPSAASSSSPPPFLEPKVEPFGSYRLASYDPKARLVSTIWSAINSNPSAYLRREQSLYSLYPGNASGSSANSGTKRRIDQIESRERPTRRRVGAATSDSDSSYVVDAVSRIKRSSARSPFIVESPGTPRSPRSPRSPSSTPRSSTPSRARAPKVQAVPSRVHDSHISELSNYAPNPETLPPGRPLKAVWKGAPMDLSEDPLASHIHPAELYLASSLRLSGELYIDSRTRLFAEKVHRLRQGLPFRRTDAQKACRIDVNKASRLFEAYEKVGWLNDDLFRQYL